MDAPIDTDIFADDPSATWYTLDTYFANEKTIVFAYDFLAGWQFTVTKKAEHTEEISWSERKAISGTGTYLLEDSWGPDELKAQLALYKKKKYDEDVRETFADFAEWIEPALIQFTV